MASSAPPNPAIAAAVANAMSRARPGEIPMERAPTSLPWRASRTRPNVPDFRLVTRIATTMATTRASTRKLLSLPKSIEPMTGRGTAVPVSSDAPPPTNGRFNTTESKK